MYECFLTSQLLQQYPLFNSKLVLKINPSILFQRLVNDSTTFPDTQTKTLASLWFLPFHISLHVVTPLIPPWQQMYLSVLLTPCSPLTLQSSPVQFSHSVTSDSLQPHELEHARPPCPSPTPGVHPNSCPSSQWCHPTISSSVVPFSACPQSLQASGSFPMSQLFASGGQSIGVSASTSVLSMNTQDWSPLGWTGWISLSSKGLSRVFSNTTV